MIELDIPKVHFDFFGCSFNFFQDCEDSRKVIEQIKQQEDLFVNIENIVSCV
jgi:hypothetical protein